MRLSGNWADPSFDGSFLPKQREVTDGGFTANWEVLELNRNYPQQGEGSFVPRLGSMAAVKGFRDEYIETAGGGEDYFGVRLLLPVDRYGCTPSTQRATTTTARSSCWCSSTKQ